jgi:cobalt transporter subunit CbtA
VARETVLAATVAGLVAALLFTLVQSIWVTPLILQAEVFEDAAEAAEHVTAGPVSAATDQHDLGAGHDDASAEHHESGAGHHHDPDAWKPQDGWQRTLFTFAANLLMGVGYSFVLVALYLLWREPHGATGGALYGLAGFAVFFAAPALGLPPELPGTAAADLTARQLWWVMTAVATAAGLMLFVSQSRWWLRALAVAIVVAPHFVPAPHPAVPSSLAPAELQSRFRLATAFCNAVFWLSLGVASGITFQKWVVGGEPAGQVKQD